MGAEICLPGLEPGPPGGDEIAAAVALAALPAITPARLRRLVVHHGAVAALALVAAGDVLDDAWFTTRLGRHDEQRRAVAERWRRVATALDPAGLAATCEQAGIAVSILGRAGYPEVLADDIEPPAVVFARGDVGALEGRRVALIGTRNATAAGRATAFELGRSLAEAGVRVVSGLARGIDGAAHRGSVAGTRAPPIGVVGSGLDVTYPREHAELWRAVAERGLLLGEAPPGAAPEGWRFPLRNRILAALSEIVVVVESREAGGSLLTVDAALKRGVAVMAVPGSVRCRSAAGVNQLLADGCAPVRDALDVLVALGLSECAPQVRRRRASRPDDPLDAEVLDVFASEALTLEAVVAATGRALPEVALVVGRLEQAGWLDRSGGWFERSDRGR